MYEQYYGMTADPFRLSPDGMHSFEHGTYRKARAYLEYALHRGEGVVLISGEPGTGKTTLVKTVARSLKNSRINLNILSCDKLDALGLLKLYASDLGIQSKSEENGVLLVEIGKELRHLNRSGVRSVLVLDEAQGLTFSGLEQARLLTNYHVENRPLLQLILVGQPELALKILSPSLVQLHQRVISSTKLTALSHDETRDYFIHRLKSVGWNNNPIVYNDIFRVLHEASEGNPRWVNQIGSRLLLHGMVEEKSELRRKDIKRVVLDLVDEALLPRAVRSRHGGQVGNKGGLLDSEY